MSELTLKQQEKQKRRRRTGKKEYPPPLVGPKHPIKWLHIKLESIFVKGIGTYIGICIIAALYYLILEKIGFMHSLWHEAVPESPLRHAIRDVGEGLLGGILAITLSWNHYKKIGKTKLSPLDKLEQKLHIPNLKDAKPFSAAQLTALLILVPLYALLGFFLGLHVVDWIEHGWHHTVHHFLPATEPAAVTANSLWEKIYKVITESWGYKVIGFITAFYFGRRPALAVIDDIQLLFAERNACQDKGLKWFHTKPYQARYNEVCKAGTKSILVPNKWGKIALIVSPVILFGLAAYGWYVLNFIAK